MLPRRSSRILPQSSPPAAFSIGGAVQVAPASAPSTSSWRNAFKADSKDISGYGRVRSPSTPPAAVELPVVAPCGDDHSLRWLYNYPRLSFVLLFVLCSYLGGIFVSFKVTSWTLEALGVHDELTASREAYLSTSRLLNSMSSCVEQSSLQYLADAKSQFEADSKRVQQLIDANDQVLTTQRNATSTCSSNFLADLQRQVTKAASGDTNSSLGCFSTAFYANVPESEPFSQSETLILSVRALLTTQAVLDAHDNVDEQQKQIEAHLLEMWQAVNSVRTSIQNTMNATSTIAMQQLNSFAPIFTDEDGSGHSQQSASRLDRVGKLVTSGLSGPLTTSASSSTLNTIRKAGVTLRKALGVLSGLHEGFSEIMDAVDNTWEVLEKQMNSTIQQATKLQQELAYAADSTAYQINRTSASLESGFKQAEAEVATSFDQLHERWQSTVKELVAQGFAPWQRLGKQLVQELTANKRQTVRPQAAIQRRYILPDRTNSSLAQEHERLTIASRDERTKLNATASSSLLPESGDEFDIDTAVLRSALVDMGVLFTRVVFFVDVGRLTLLAADLAVGLITESYSDIPMVDIRGITTIDTIGSIWEVLVCKHSFTAVCYTLVTQCSQLFASIVRFLLLAIIVLVVTTVLLLWKGEHLTSCGNAAKPLEASTPSQTAMQSITRTLFEYSGNLSSVVVDPLDAIEKYTTIVNGSIHDDYAALVSDSTAAWKNQSATLKELGDYVETTSTLVRRLQDCEATEDSNMAADASISSKCLTSSLINPTGIGNPSATAGQLSENAAFLHPSSAFATCFPNGEQMSMGRQVMVYELQHRLACATEKAVYLSAVSWWLLIVIFVANRFVARMVIKAVGMYWWRFLSADKLHFVGFCQEDGSIVAPDELPHAVKRHLREVKWQVAGRLLGIALVLVSVVVGCSLIFRGIL